MCVHITSKASLGLTNADENILFNHNYREARRYIPIPMTWPHLQLSGRKQIDVIVRHVQLRLKGDVLPRAYYCSM